MNLGYGTRYQAEPPEEHDSFFDETKDMFFGLDADGSGTISVRWLRTVRGFPVFMKIIIFR